MNRKSLIEFTAHHRLIVAISGAILTAMLMTAVSLSLYFTSGAHVLDLSRPGLETTRETIDKSTFDADEFEQDGPINHGVIDDFEKIYQDGRRHLQAIDGFNNQRSLSDDSLRLTED